MSATYNVIDTRMPDLLRGTRPLAGIFVGPPAPWLVEMCGHAGFDFVVLDNEHGPSSTESLEHMMRAARASGVMPIVRAYPQDILRVLDMGASGIQVPQVDTADQARHIVALAKYPPVGIRGAAFSNRAAGFGFFGGEKQISDANNGTAVIVQVESRTAMENVDAIAAVPGVDAVFFGPNDLSFSMGYPGQVNHPEVVAALEHGIRRAKAAGKAAGILAMNPAEFERWSKVGANYMCAVSTGLITGALRTYMQGVREPGKA